MELGTRIGYLTVISSVYFKMGKRGRLKYVDCKCDCGETRSIYVYNLIRSKKPGGHPQYSCGCVTRARNAIGLNYTHGGSCEQLYGVWLNMRRRCGHPSSRDYALYGGRGIEVCSEWARDYTAFREWALEHGYRKGLQLDRIDGEQGYFPGNCRFATPTENGRNRRNTQTLTAFGQTKTLMEWAEDPRCKVSYDALHYRVSSGFWTPEDAISVDKRATRHMKQVRSTNR